ncbi:hypothetical protein HYH03_002168 [Edaphochlamys debaryana]|uniref:Uncharacterized protein n=1 Tax=Edaphochlamys debaryana TaxID=47281 RepID=A0A835YLI0_9CHLO|nr:hypothetical protein HYH03_002168 [Edaphochlamys debaryana]|eukprot:KAG2499879.1 hypothetical protein HYH03_002168 [Edaphochlamys debaryana]
MAAPLLVPPAFVIVGLSCFIIFFIEVVTLLFVANSSSYRRLIADIDRTQKELDRIGAAGASAASGAAKKRERALEVQMTYLGRDFFFHRMKQMVIMTALLGMMFYVLRTWYMGKVVAQLPFAPISFFSRLTQQWIESPAPYDCSFLFLYILCNMGIKPNVAKLMGTALPTSVAKATDMSSMTGRFTKLATAKNA